MKLSTKLKRLGACEDAIAWIEPFTLAQEAWDACERADWMLWIIGRTINCDPWTDGLKPLLACALDCACTVQHLWPEDQKEKIGEAVGILRLWIDEEVSLEQAKEARHNLAAAHAYADAAYAGAYAAADAAYADAHAAYADAHAAYAARAKSLKDQAILIRTKHYPHPPK